MWVRPHSRGPCRAVRTAGSHGCLRRRQCCAIATPCLAGRVCQFNGVTVGKVAQPQPVRCGGGEVPLHSVRLLIPPRAGVAVLRPPARLTSLPKLHLSPAQLSDASAWPREAPRDGLQTGEGSPSPAKHGVSLLGGVEAPQALSDCARPDGAVLVDRQRDGACP